MLSSAINSLIPLLQQLFFIFVGFLGFCFLIVFHELGHFLFAKLFHVRVPSFSIGFGPKLISKKIGETEFSLSAIPCGGYVEMAGSAEIGQGEQKEAHAIDEGSFLVKPFYQKFLIMSGGILFNLMFAYCAMIILFMTGIPQTKFMGLTNGTTVIENIKPGLAAETSGLRIGDRIIAIQGQPVNNDISRAMELLQPIANTPADFIIERNGVQFTQNIQVSSTDHCGTPIATLGIEWRIAETPPHSFVDAVKKGIATTNRWIVLTISSLAHLFSKKGMSGAVGPIGILAMTANSAAQGFPILIILLALLSINLAVFNLIPLPIVDGGQIFFYAIEALIGRSLPERIREYIHIATWILFIIFFLYASTQDIYCLIKPYIEKLLIFFK